MSNIHTDTIVRDELRRLMAKQLYDIEIGLGIAFHAAYNGFSDEAAELIEEVLGDVSTLRKGYEAQSDEEMTR